MGAYYVRHTSGAWLPIRLAEGQATHPTKYLPDLALRYQVPEESLEIVHLEAEPKDLATNHVSEPESVEATTPEDAVTGLLEMVDTVFAGWDDAQREWLKDLVRAAARPR